MAISRANIGKEIKMAGKKRVGLKRGGQPKKKKTKDWMGKVTKSIKKRGTKGVCTGSKFGGPTCPPGSKRYALAKVLRAQAAKKSKGKRRA